MDSHIREIYLDYNATTPMDPLVFQAMEPYFHLHFGNPASAGHRWGWAAEGAVTKARSQVASLIGAQANEVIFTSGATESNNWAIFGLIKKIRREDPKAPILVISSCVEHSSVLRALEAIQEMNVEVDFLPVNKFGQVEIENIESAIKPHTRLISLIWVNNEIGTINQIEKIASIAKKKEIYFHTDATQAVGKIPVNMAVHGIDLMSFSGHKIYGPKGVGALYLRSKSPRVQIHPLLFGGGQEKGIRSGTLNVPGIVGLGAAAELCQKNLLVEGERQKDLRNLFWEKLQASIPGVHFNGHPDERAPNNLNITLPGIKTERILGHLHQLGVSTGSACGTGALVISHVLKGLGLTQSEIQCSMRMSIGRWTTEKDIEDAVSILKKAIDKIQ